ncbi:unnamed protein product [Enterobius vermicularis]|uniref:AAA domain-containing protein n=1 Tax=Enterobius vermicularis TaxID=51028 RepID=A0A0N4V953_ENTVE|nr:unnamed protein product [Enterobius vermicularis]
MKLRHSVDHIIPINLLYLLLLYSTKKVDADSLIVDVIETVVSVAETVSSSYQNFKCRLQECCYDVIMDIDKFIYLVLEYLIHSQLYGQHLAKKVILKAISSHWLNRNPNKALVISLHGTPGTGKTYTSQMIAQSMFRKGEKSNYVHMLPSTLHFSDSRIVQQYKNDLKSWIRGNISLCDRNLFIFDEVDKAPQTVFDVVKPFTDYHSNIDGVDYRKSIFIFISNAAGGEVADRTLEHYNRGDEREQITLEEMEEPIALNVYNSIGGMEESQLIASSLIDHFVPYLPLERKHVILCIEKYLKSRFVTPTKKRVESIADSMNYFPKSSGVYSSSGCKRVNQKVDLYLETEELEEMPDLKTAKDNLDEL